MKRNRIVLFLAAFVFCLSLTVCFVTAFYVADSVENNIFALSFNNGAAISDIDFLTRENHYFTFAARMEADGATETMKTKVDVIGTNANFASITKLGIKSGAFFNDIHEKKFSEVAILNSASALYFFGDDRCVGNSISSIERLRYLSSDVQVLDLEQYKNIMLQRPRIVVFFCWNIHHYSYFT